MAATSSLAAQLQRLAVPQSATLVQDSKKRSSFLFDPKEAAKISRDEAFRIGLSGFVELVELNQGIFNRFRDSLFSETSKSFQRSVQSKEANAKLDKQLKAFLISLSPYFQLKASHRALEWLIYRFQIESFNTEALLMCILPYHETRVFVRALQLLNLNRQPHLVWLAGFQQQGSPVPSSVIALRCMSDEGFLRLVVKCVMEHLKLFRSQSNQTSSAFSSGTLDTCVAFFASAVLGALHSFRDKDIPDHFVGTLIPLIIEGLKCPVMPNLHAAVILIVTQMAQRQEMDAEFLEEVLKSLANGMKVVPENDDLESSRKILRSSLQAVLLLCQLQKPQSLPDELVVALLEEEVEEGNDVCRNLPPLLDTADATDFLKAFCRSLQTESQRSSFLRLVKELSLSPEEAKLVVEAVLAKDDLKESEWTKEVVKHVRSKYNEVYEALATSSDLPNVFDESEDVVVQLKHPNVNMRLRAVQRLANCNQGFSRDGLVKYLLIHLAVEESSKVVSAILTSFPAVVESSEFQEKIAEKFLKLVEDKWTHVQEKILRFSHELPASSLVRFLFPWNGERLKLFTALVENTKLLRLLGVESISQLEFEEANFPVIFKTVLDSAPAEFPLKPQSLGTPLTTPSEKLDVAIYLLFQVSQLRKIDLPPSEMGFSILQTLQAYVMGMRHAFNFACGTKTDLIKEEEFLENIHKIIGKCCVDDYVPMELVIFVVNSLAEEKSHDGRLISSSLLWLLELLTTQIGKSDSCTPSLMCLIKKLLNTSESPLQLILLALDISSTQTDPCGQAQHMLCRLFLQMLPTAIPADKNLACLAFMCVVSSLPMAIPSKKRSVLLKKTLEDLQDEHNVPSQSLRNVVHHINEGLDLASVLECPEYLAGFLEGHMSAEESSSTKRLSPSRRQTRQTQPEPSLMDLFLKLLHPDGEMKHLLNTKEAVLKLLSSVSYQELLETLLLDLGRDDTQKEMEVTSYQALILDHFIRSPPSIIFPSKSSSNLYQKFKSLLLNDEEASKYLLRRISSSYVSGLATVDLTEDFLNFLLDHAPVDVTDERSSTNSASRPSLPLVALKEVMRICKHINIDAAFLQKRFFKLVPSLQEAGSGRKRGRGLKRSTRTVTMVTANQSSSREWREISFILEILEGKKKIRQPTCLVGTLFEMLTKVLNWSEQEKCEYLKQLLLSSLHRCMSEREGSALGQSNEDPSMDSDDSDSDSSTGEESKSNPKLSSFDQGELLIQCLRSSSTSLVHHHTLRLLTLITKSSPQSVASSIIPIFTFIGTSLLKQDDAASLKLIEDTMQAVVPLLKKHEPGLGTETVCVNPKRPLTISLMRVFRNALPDIPTHRRLPLLEHLLQCLSPPRTRWILVTLLLEEQVRKQADKPKFFVDLALQLLLHGIDEGIDDPTSGVLECLETSKEVLQWLMALPLEVEQTQGKRRHKQAASESLLIDLESLEPTFLRQLQYQTLSLVVKVFCNSDFQGGLGAALETNERAERQSKDLNNLLMEMIKLLLDWSHTVSTRLKSRMGGNVEDSGMQKKFIQALFQRLYDLIHNLCLALPMNLFLQMVLGLLEDDKTDVVAQRKTLELLNTRLLGQEGPAVRRDEAWDEEVCLAFLPVLMRLMSLGKKTTRRVATGAGDQSGEKDRFELDCKLFVAQGSLFALKIFVKKFAASHTAQFSELVPRICKIVSQSSSTGCLPLLSSSVLALAYLAVELRFHAVTSLDVLMPTLLSTLAETDKIEKDPVLLLSCVTSLLRIVESLSAFIVPYLPGVLSLLTSLPQEQQPGDKPRRVINKIQKLRHLIATEIEPRVLLPVLRQTMIEEGHSVHTSILSEHINQMTKKEVADNFPLLTNLFLSLISAQPIKTFTEKESPFLAAVVALVLKLNEETFTLLLMKLINWAFTKAEEESSPEAPQKKKRKKLKERRLKCVAFFSITKKLSEELKSLFVGFASYFLSHVAETLADEQLNVDPTILDVTLITLQNLCRYDEDKSAIREEMVEPLTLSLMSCLRVIPIQDNMPGEYVKDVLNPTLSKFAAVLQSPQQKQFLLAVLANTKDESKEIRLATVGAMSDIFEELESACAQWLPEILPALSELLEDDEPDVEAAAQDVLVLLGKTTGENVQEYL